MRVSITIIAETFVIVVNVYYQEDRENTKGITG